MCPTYFDHLTFSVRSVFVPCGFGGGWCSAFLVLFRLTAAMTCPVIIFGTFCFQLRGSPRVRFPRLMYIFFDALRWISPTHFHLLYLLSILFCFDLCSVCVVRCSGFFARFRLWLLSAVTTTTHSPSLRYLTLLPLLPAATFFQPVSVDQRLLRSCVGGSMFLCVRYTVFRVVSGLNMTAAMTRRPCSSVQSSSTSRVTL
mmetsp:Transcript_22121/g.52274  ORF Transcript_22121/g.52274 Transcript_22121/m.52274 type:complete len:200 (+) Transcript_22121:1783-2382(+)